MLEKLPPPVTLKKLKRFVQPELDLPKPSHDTSGNLPAYPRSKYVDRGSTFSLHDIPNSSLVGEVAPSIGAAIERKARASQAVEAHTNNYKKAAASVRRLLE